MVDGYRIPWKEWDEKRHAMDQAIKDAMVEMGEGGPAVESRRLPYPRVGRSVRKDHHAGDYQAIWYERSPIGAKCRLGMHHGVAEVVLDVWKVFNLSRRLECPCGKYARIETY